MPVPDLTPISTAAISTGAPALDIGALVTAQNSAPLTSDGVAAIGAPVEQKTPVVAEIASIRRNILIPQTTNWYLEPQDPTLRSRGGGWDYSIYVQAERDDKVWATLQKRKAALNAYPIQIDAASKRPQDVAAKELVERAMKSMNFAQFTSDLLDAINRGYSPVELMYELVDTEVGPEWHATGHFKRDQRRFRFDDLLRLRLLTWRDMTIGELLPDRKFVVFTFNPEDGDPYGRGLGEMLYWRAWIKTQNKKQWLTFNDRFAVPVPEGTYQPEAGDDEKNALIDALLSFANGSPVVHPEGTSVNLLETARAAGIDTFKILQDVEDQEIESIVLGSTYAQKAGQLDGGSGADADQKDRLELARADANSLAQVINRSWVKWIVFFNDPDARPPTLSWKIEEEEDLGEAADRDTKISQMGFEPSEAYINEKYGGEWTKKAAPDPSAFMGPGGQAQLDGLSFAQRALSAITFVAAIGAGRRTPGTDSETLLGRLAKRFAFAQPTAGGKDAPAPTDIVANKLGDQLAGALDPITDQWVEEFRRVVAEAGSLEDARDRLIDLYAHKMDGDHFAETMAAAVLVADAAGRLDADRHAKNAGAK